MKTFGLFMVFQLLFSIFFSIFLKEWDTPDIVILSTVTAYIMQQYFNEQIKR